MEMNGQGFVAIYRWNVEQRHIAAFRQRWSDATQELRALGGKGSLLGRDRDGHFVAIALWTSEEARDSAFARTTDGTEWPPAERLEPILVDVIDDLWNVSPFRLNAK